MQNQAMFGHISKPSRLSRFIVLGKGKYFLLEKQYLAR